MIGSTPTTWMRSRTSSMPICATAPKAELRVSWPRDVADYGPGRDGDADAAHDGAEDRPRADLDELVAVADHLAEIRAEDAAEPRRRRHDAVVRDRGEDIAGREVELELDNLILIEGVVV
jgi:hypothetical protein